MRNLDKKDYFCNDISNIDHCSLLLPCRIRMRHMNTEEAVKWLTQKGVKPTSNRILVLKELEQESHPVSLQALSSQMLYMDKSSIFRVLTLFLKHDVVHSFEDGRGLLNYELCNRAGHCMHNDGHIHFYCETCQQSFCLEDICIPHLSLPEGFSARSMSFVIKGECPQCARRSHKQVCKG